MSAKSAPPSSTNPLPAGWKESYDEKHQRWYFYNPTTKETQWTHPSQPDKKSIWVEKFDEKYKRPYWYNKKTRQSSWTKPTDEASIGNQSGAVLTPAKRKTSDESPSIGEIKSSAPSLSEGGFIYSPMTAAAKRSEIGGDDKLVLSQQNSSDSLLGNGRGGRRKSSTSTDGVASPVTSRPKFSDKNQDGKKGAGRAGLPNLTDDQLSLSTEPSNNSVTGSPMPPISPHRKRAVAEPTKAQLEQVHLASSFNTDRDRAFKDGGLFGKQKLASMQRSSAEDVKSSSSNADSRRHYSSKVPSNESLLEPSSPVEAPESRIPVGASSTGEVQEEEPVPEEAVSHRRSARLSGRSGAFSSILTPNANKKPLVILTSRPFLSTLHQRRLGSKSPPNGSQTSSGDDGEKGPEEGDHHVDDGLTIENGVVKFGVSDLGHMERDADVDLMYDAPSNLSSPVNAAPSPSTMADFRRDLAPIIFAAEQADPFEEEDPFESGNQPHGTEAGNQVEDAGAESPESEEWTELERPDAEELNDAQYHNKERSENVTNKVAAQESSEDYNPFETANHGQVATGLSPTEQSKIAVESNNPFLDVEDAKQVDQNHLESTMDDSLQAPLDAPLDGVESNQTADEAAEEKSVDERNAVSQGENEDAEYDGIADADEGKDGRGNEVDDRIEPPHEDELDDEEMLSSEEVEHVQEREGGQVETSDDAVPGNENQLGELGTAESPGVEATESEFVEEEAEETNAGDLSAHAEKNEIDDALAPSAESVASPSAQNLFHATEEGAEEIEEVEDPDLSSDSIEQILQRQRGLKERMAALSSRKKDQPSLRLSDRALFMRSLNDDITDSSVEAESDILEEAPGTSSDLDGKTTLDSSMARGEKRAVHDLASDSLGVASSKVSSASNQTATSQVAIEASASIPPKAFPPRPELTKSSSVKALASKLAESSGAGGLPIKFGAPPPVPSVSKRPLESSFGSQQDQRTVSRPPPAVEGSQLTGETGLLNEAHMTRAAIPAGLRRQPSRRLSNFAEIADL